MNALVERIGWMLIHSVWEDTLLWVILQAVLFALAKRTSQSRYLAAWFALLAMAVLPWLTFGISDLSARIRTAHTFRNETATTAPLRSGSQQITLQKPLRELPSPPPPLRAARHAASSALARLLPLIVSAWIVGLCVSGVRLWIRWSAVDALVRQPLQLPSPDWNERFDKLLRLSGVTMLVRWGETAAASVPVVAGWLKPVILIPLGALTVMPPEQVEAILLHELAHLFRHDYLVNLLQNIVESIFFYHPAVWMTSRRIRIERELACDDLTIQWCESPRTYAEALAGFERLRARSPLLAVTGEGELLTRIRRILSGRSEPATAPIFALAGFCGIGIYFASMFLVPLLAQEIVTASERVARIQALQSPPKLEMPSDHGRSALVSGTIQTEDGQPLPASLMKAPGQSLTRSEACVTSAEIGVTSEGSIQVADVANRHKFYANTETGRIGLGIWAEGYAPLRKIGLHAPEGKLSIDMVLRRGFPARLEVTGPAGQPLKDVTIKAISAQPDEPLELSMPPVQTDAAGLATFGNVESDSEIHLIASAPGWQMTDRIVDHWTDGEALVWKLEPAKATAGIVIDQITHKPVSGADILLAARRGAGGVDSTYSPQDGDLLGHTDDSGHFDLKDLATDQSYRIYVRAAGYQISVFPIECGDQNRICEVSPGLRLRGKILDPNGMLAGFLATNKSLHAIELEAQYTIQATPYSGYGQSERNALPKLGAEIPFSFDNLPKGRTALFFAIAGLQDRQYEIDLEKNVDDYVIDLGAKPSAEEDNRPLRTVEISIKTAGSTVPMGILDAVYIIPGKEGSYARHRTIPLAAGKATTSVRTPTTLDIRADGLLGYWFAPQTFEIPAGEGPFTRSVTATDAGVIHGTVTFSEGMKSRVGEISPVAIKRPNGVPPGFLAGGKRTILSDKGDYVTPPLPFGGTYAIVLDAGPSYFVSDPCQVDAEHPLVIRNFDVAPGHDTLRARFVDEKNNPIAYQEVTLSYHPTPYDDLVCHAATTGSDGSFTIPNMNFAVPGNYEVQLDGNDWERTKIRIDARTPQPVTIQARRTPK